MLQDLLWLILSAVIVRAVWRLVDGVMAGVAGTPRGAARETRTEVPTQGVQMVRDPVCGTYVLPSRAIVVADGSRPVYFCSTTCRDKYRARTA
jgi:uncharacterized protein